MIHFYKNILNQKGNEVSSICLSLPRMAYFSSAMLLVASTPSLTCSNMYTVCCVFARWSHPPRLFTPLLPRVVAAPRTALLTAAPAKLAPLLAAQATTTAMVMAVQTATAAFAPSNLVATTMVTDLRQQRGPVTPQHQQLTRYLALRGMLKVAQTKERSAVSKTES